MLFYRIVSHHNKFCGLIHKLVLVLTCLCLSTHLSAQTAPNLQLANVYDPNITIKDYWVSEKLDGVRAYWNGAQFMSKQGNSYAAPVWFTKDFPSFALDGELWIARNTFDELSGIVRKKTPIDSEWRKVKYQVFDLPEHSGEFDERLNILKKLYESEAIGLEKDSRSLRPKHIALIKQFKVATHTALMSELDRVTKAGGEGLMLHLGRSKYHGRRNDDLLKVKQYFDAEAKVIKYYTGKGKYQNMMGAMLVETLSDNNEVVRFRIGTGFSDQERLTPPPIGSIITYKYFGFTKTGLPKFASFMRIRPGYPRD